MKSDMNDWQLGSGAAAIATKLHYFNTDFDLEDICWSPAASTGALSNRTPWSWRRTFQTEYYIHNKHPSSRQILGILSSNLHKAKPKLPQVTRLETQYLIFFILT